MGYGARNLNTPDFERVLRDLEVDLSKNPELVKARHKGEDRARFKILGLIIVIFVASLLAVILFN